MTDDFNPDDLHPEDVALDPDLTSEMTRLRPIIEQEEGSATSSRTSRCVCRLISRISASA